MAIERITSKGQLVPLKFFQDAVAASQTDAQLSVNESAAAGIHLVDGYTMPWAGSIVAVTADLDAAATVGTLSVGASVGGTEDANTTISITTLATHSKVIGRRVVKFAAGAIIGAEITSGATWNGTASDLAVVVWVLLQLENI